MTESFGIVSVKQSINCIPLNLAYTCEYLAHRHQKIKWCIFMVRRENAQDLLRIRTTWRLFLGLSVMQGSNEMPLSSSSCRG